MKPIIKWAGGKSSISPDIESFLPTDIKESKEINKYIEPFFGGGGFLFYLLSNGYNINKIYISDLNYKLYNFYSVIKNDFIEFKNRLDSLIEKFFEVEEKKDFYLYIRSLFNRENDDINLAIYFLFLNKTCFNGLYRENKKGEFNVPFGKYKKYSFYDEKNLKEIKEVLDRSYLYNKDFRKFDDFNKSFFYLDPPYIPLNETSYFSSYIKDGFGSKEQSSLLDFLYEINKRNNRFLLSNSYNEKSKEIYKDFNINIIEAKRSINSKGSKRGKIKEVLINNYD